MGFLEASIPAVPLPLSISVFSMLHLIIYPHMTQFRMDFLDASIPAVHLPVSISVFSMLHLIIYPYMNATNSTKMFVYFQIQASQPEDR
jgi:hypothetical protein